MTINATSRATLAPVDHSSTREARDYDHSHDEFAGMFAGAVHSSAPKVEHKKPKEGTSELDRQDEPNEDEKKVKRQGVRHPAAAAKSSDGTTKTDDAADAEAGDTTAPGTGDVIQSTAALDPELQGRLARVMQRLRDETGQNAKVAETYRSQDRQNVLFAQGRETPGDVVTWTRNSKHTQGRAVDLVLQGGAAGFDAYGALQRIAKEEGLRTLGAKDPGHLELSGANGTAVDPNTLVANDATPSIPVEPADASGPGQVSLAQLAKVAQVAQVSVARTADVARVATVAQPGVAKGATVAGVPDTQQQAKHAPAPSVQASFSGGAHSGAGDSTDERGDSAKGEGRGGYSALAAAVAQREASSFHSALDSVGASTGTTAAERAAKLIAAFEDAPARPLSQITMSVDAGNGTSDKVQIALRGSSLSATIDAADARGAQTMSAKSGELVRALAKDGIDVESLRVRAAVSSTAVASTASSSSTSDSSTSSRFERPNNPWQQQERQRSQDERRQQQRERRGGKEQ